MPNRAERRRNVKITALREQAVEALGQTPYFDIELDNGETVRVWHPLLVDDAAQLRIDAFSAGEDLDKDEDGNIKLPHTVKGKRAEPHNIRQARAILGNELHKHFLKNGGHSNDVELAWTELVRQHTDDVLGDLTEVEAEDPKSETP